MNSPSVLEKALGHWRITVTLCAIVAVFGLISLLTMPRQEFPDFTIRQGLVVGVMPGATSGEVEEQLTRPVEDYLFSFGEVDKAKTYSISKDGQMIIFVELRAAVTGGESPAFWAKLRHGLNELKAQKLPPQVLALVGNNDFGDTSAVLFAVSAEGRSPREIEKYIEVLEAQLRRLDATSKLKRVGHQGEVIRVTIARDRLAKYGLRTATVWGSLQGLGASPSSPRVDGADLELPVYVGKVLRSEAEIGEAIVVSDPTGPQVRLRDIATITREYGHDDSFVRFNGKTAVVLSIEMHTGNDITHFGAEIDHAVEEARRELPPGVDVTRVADQPKAVAASVNHFLQDFAIAVLSVIAVTMLLLPLRIAAVAAITIPVCIFGTLACLNALGIQLQTVSLAGLILVLGMVVDNAIVIIDEHVEKLDHGVPVRQAAWSSARDLLVPVISATVAIVLSYVPLSFFLTGMAGEFVGSLPITVAVALGTSLVVAAFLVPLLNASFIRRGIRQTSGRPRKSSLDYLQEAYDALLERAFRHPWITVGIGVLAVALAFAGGARLPQQLFPKVDRDQFAVEIYLPDGRSLKSTDAMVRELEDVLLHDGRVRNVTSFVGEGSPRFHSLYAPNPPSRNYAQLIVNTTDDRATEEVLRDYDTRLRGAFANGWVRWKQLDLQSSRAPIEIRLSGNDIDEIKRVAAAIQTRARSVEGATWVRTDWEDPVLGVEVVPDIEATSRLGVPPAALRMSLGLGLRGLPVTTVWEGEYPVKVQLEEPTAEAATLVGLRHQYASSVLLASPIPIEQLATIRPTWNDGAIVRRNGVRTMTVRVDVAFGTLAMDVQRKLEPAVASAVAGSGVRLEYGGEKESQFENYVPMGKAMATTVAAIYIVLLCQFGRHRKALLVMATMPLSLLGAVLGLTVTGYPFGFTSFVGVISLMGIVVRNGIILVGYAEELEASGLGAREAAMAAGKRRMRPIYLTSMAAAIGVVPMILSRSTLWGPLGAVTCFGLLCGMVLTLVVLPVAYWLVCRQKQAPLGPAALAPTVAAVLSALIVFTWVAPAEAQITPLTLTRAKQLTVEHNAHVEESDLEVDAAKETEKAAFTKYFPQVTAGALGLFAAKPLMSINTASGSLPVYDGNPAHLSAATQFAYMPPNTMEALGHANALGIVAIQPVFAGGRILNGNRLAKVGVTVAELHARVARRDAVVDTETKYWQLLSLTEKRRTLNAYDDLLQSLEKQVVDAVRSGLNTRNDQLKVSLQRQQVAVDRIRLESGIQLAQRDLARHVGLPEETTLDLSDGLPTPQDPAPLANNIKGGVARRPESQLLEEAVKAEHLQAEIKRGEMLPSASVGGALVFTDLGGMAATSNAVAFGMVTVPLTGVWEGVHATASARKREQVAKRRMVDTRRLLGLDAEKSWADLIAAWRMTSVADAGVEQADVNLKEVHDFHMNGMKTFSDVLEAQALRQQALDRRIDSRVEYWMKRAAYLRSVGAAESVP